MQLADYLIESMADAYPGVDESVIVDSITDELETVISDELRWMKLPQLPTATGQSIFEKRLARMREAARTSKRSDRDEKLRFLASLWSVQSKLDGFKTDSSGKSLGQLGSL